MKKSDHKLTINHQVYFKELKDRTVYLPSSIYDLRSGSIDEVIGTFKEYKKLFGPTLHLRVEFRYGEWEFIWSVSREETDEEFKKRLAQRERKRESTKRAAEARKEKQRKEDLRELERLKKKYEG